MNVFDQHTVWFIRMLCSIELNGPYDYDWFWSCYRQDETADEALLRIFAEEREHQNGDVATVLVMCHGLSGLYRLAAHASSTVPRRRASDRIGSVYEPAEIDMQIEVSGKSADEFRVTFGGKIKRNPGEIRPKSAPGLQPSHDRKEHLAVHHEHTSPTRNE